MLDRLKRTAAALTSPSGLRCSFCGKDKDEVQKLIAGPAVYICDACVNACNSILADDARAWHSEIAEGAERTDVPNGETEQRSNLISIRVFPLSSEIGPVC